LPELAHPSNVNTKGSLLFAPKFAVQFTINARWALASSDLFTLGFFDVYGYISTNSFQVIITNRSCRKERNWCRCYLNIFFPDPTNDESQTQYLIAYALSLVVWKDTKLEGRAELMDSAIKID
jgi:hypothetical protein